MVHSGHCYLNLLILCGAMPAPDLPQKRKIDGSSSSSADPFGHEVHGDLQSKGKVLILFSSVSQIQVSIRVKKRYIHALPLVSNGQALARRAKTLAAKTRKILFVPSLPKAGTDKFP